MPPDTLNVLTWHVHGSYLESLAACGHRIYLPVGRGDEPGYAGRTDGFDWPSNLVEVDAARVSDLELDVVLSQSVRNWQQDRHEILSPEQLREVPMVHVEHDPPREHPTDTRHPIDDPDALIVHVTHFNRLMWDSGRTPTAVIEHGVRVPDDVTYTGELERGLVVVNGLGWRGRRLGLDLFLAARERLPLDLVGMESIELGGLGEVRPRELPRLMGRYRFFFHPVRYTSLGLALLQAMAVGVPPVALATTEVVETIRDRVSGFTSTNPDVLHRRMEQLLEDAELAHRLGAGARHTARTRYGIDRFAAEWHALLADVTQRRRRGARRDPQVMEEVA
ncbi:MAG TPA: glycosyltransferase family 4 protein [Candidatus Limnocylindria bacterium]|nr:glycosyltransferase family 4 protein [Candidatus Limnocylindria bacterium]